MRNEIDMRTSSIPMHKCPKFISPIVPLSKVFIRSLVLLSLIFSGGCDRTPSEKSKSVRPDIILRLGTVVTPSNRGWEAARLIKEELEEQSKGRIQVRLYDSGVLGAERQLLETCYFGVIEMVLCTSSVITTIEPTFSILDLPYLFTSQEHQERVLQGPIGEELLSGLKKRRLQGLAFYAFGMRHVFNAKGRAIKEPDDLKGLKIRVMESPVMIDALNAMGASATPLSHSELFQALKTGVVDGAENNPMQFVAAKYFEADCLNYSLTGHFANQMVVVVSQTWMKRIQAEHPDLHDLIQRIPREIAPQFKGLWDEGVRQSYDRMKKANVTVNSVETIESFLNMVRPVYDSFFEKYPEIPHRWIEKIREEAKK